MRNVGIAGVNRNLAEPVSWEEDEVGSANLYRPICYRTAGSQRKRYYCETSDFASVLSEGLVVLPSGLV